MQKKMLIGKKNLQSINDLSILNSNREIYIFLIHTVSNRDG